MIDLRLRRQLTKAADRLRHDRWLKNMIVVWLLLAVAGILCSLANRFWGWALPLNAFAFTGLGLVAALVASYLAFRHGSNHRYVAQRVENAFPELQSCLLAALDTADEKGRLGYLQDRVVGQALVHAYQRGWETIISVSHLARWHAAHAAAFVVFCLSLVFVAKSAPARLSADGGVAERSWLESSDQFDVTIEPGNTEVERGTSLLVMARFEGPLPPDATLVFEAIPSATTAAQQPESKDKSATAEQEPTPGPQEGRIKMTKALDDPLFGGSVASVNDELKYFVEFGGQRSETYHVGVFEYPRLVKADATLLFPRYTTMAEKIVQDVRHMSAVQGTRIKLQCRLNKAVASAKLLEKDGTTLALAASDLSSPDYSTEFVLEKTQRFTLQLVDQQGRANKETAEFVFTALPNNPPDLKLAAPARDVEVSPLEELQLKAKAFDDFGLNRVGVSFALAGREEKELVLTQQVAAKERVDVDQLVALENLGAQPDELLSYYFWAEDTGPDGQTRRVSSDMYFAEVRPFEEIFRQGDQPPSGEGMPSQSGNANQAENLSQLQKEIVNATWKLVRRETGAKPTSAFVTDVGLVHESQTKALDQATELSQNIQDEQSLRHVGEVLKNMEKAVEQLATAKSQASTQSLRPALEAEQAAYQSLLKLRAREHQVIRQQRQQRQRGAGGGSQNSRSQQQLQQLDLKDKENRYETERTAKAQEDAKEQEMRQVLNRLRELAQRQNDLNERLKELQAELQQAATQEQKEELQRQLKRLQEEQEQILRDTDELQSRMDQPQNTEQMSEASQQLTEARERVRQSSESLNQGQVQQAVSSGSRAQQDFEQLRDEFRKQTSGHFREAMREMQQEAQQLEEREQGIAQQIKELNDPTKKETSLRDTGTREKVANQLTEQQQQLEKLLQQMRDTIEQAEQPQPLLAEQLYNTAREAQQKDPGRGLEMTRQLLNRGFDEQARQHEEPVGRAISQLREGVDRAAENVLSDETEALRRAQSELRDLSQQVRNELRQQGQLSDQPGNADPTNPNGENGQSQDPSQQANDESQKSDAGSSESKSESKKGSGGSSEQPTDEQSKSGKSSKAGGKSGESGKSGSSQSDPSQSEQSQSEQSPSESQKSDEQNAKGQGKNGSKSKQSSKGSGKGGGKGEGGGQESTDANGEPSGENTPQDSENPGQQPGQQNGSSRLAGGDRSGQRTGLDRLSGFTGGGGNEEMLTPFTGNNFRGWSDRLRDVEESLSDPELRGEAARIRERARAIRAESQRHSALPNWDLVKMQVSEPLVELLDRVSQELLKRSGNDSLTPIDRDPVPPQYTDPVRRYFERLGAGQ
jgi:hypothetical protein